MSSSSERGFIIGGTGKVGSKVVQDLLDNNVVITLYARTPSKVESLFPINKRLVNIVQAGIQGHIRLFLLIIDSNNMVKLKSEIVKTAFEAVMKQSSISNIIVNMGWRTSYIGSFQYASEKAKFDLPNCGNIVTLRPGSFMSNFLYIDHPLPSGMIFDTSDSDRRQGYISPNDIGAVAAVVLREDIAKHDDGVYSLIGDVRTLAEHAQILSCLLGQEITFKRSSQLRKGYDDSRVTPEIPILLGREPETLEEYLTTKKHVYLQ